MRPKRAPGQARTPVVAARAGDFPTPAQPRPPRPWPGQTTLPGAGARQQAGGMMHRAARRAPTPTVLPGSAGTVPSRTRDRHQRATPPPVGARRASHPPARSRRLTDRRPQAKATRLRSGIQPTPHEWPATTSCLPRTRHIAVPRHAPRYNIIGTAQTSRSKKIAQSSHLYRLSYLAAWIGFARGRRMKTGRASHARGSRPGEGDHIRGIRRAGRRAAEISIAFTLQQFVGFAFASPAPHRRVRLPPTPPPEAARAWRASRPPGRCSRCACACCSAPVCG